MAFDGVRAVLFDYGLVLTGPPDPAAWERMKSLLQAEEQPFSDAYWRYRHPYDRGELNGDTYWNSVAEDLDRIPTAAERDLLKAADVDLWTQPNEAMIAWAADLQKAGIPTGILSNIGDAMEYGIRERCEWLGAFNHHTFSHRLQLAKPEPEIYQHAAEGLQAAPSEILFIDDREENIAAARAVGMQAIRYTDHESFRAALEREGLGGLLSPNLERA